MRFKFSELRTTYFCTGARNHDLLQWFNTPLFELDERIASFKALGSAKVTGLTAAVCTTSGTAVSECISAMLEAYYSDLPLVLITGDRPKKQHGTGAPQTLDHESLTRSCRRSYFEISAEELPGFEVENPLFPLHINVIVDDTTAHAGAVKRSKDPQEFEKFLATCKAPLFLFSHESKSMRPFVERFKKSGLPFYAETLSCAHDLSPIRYEAQLLELFRSGAFDTVIRVGHTPLSKVWRLLETRILPVLSFDSRDLSALSYGTLVAKSSRELLDDEQWWKALDGMQAFAPMKNIKDDSFLDGLKRKYPRSEISLMSKIHDLLPENATVYLGNSLVIRNFEIVQRRSFKVHANRGVNGIDGQLSTAIGMATSMDTELYCLLGDLTLRYDLSALADFPPNLRLIVINNRGGRIFESLGLDARIILPHESDFREDAQIRNLSYSNNVEDIKNSMVTEIFTDLDEGRNFTKELRS